MAGYFEMYKHTSFEQEVSFSIVHIISTKDEYLYCTHHFKKRSISPLIFLCKNTMDIPLLITVVLEICGRKNMCDNGEINHCHYLSAGVIGHAISYSAHHILHLSSWIMGGQGFESECNRTVHYL